MHRLYKLFFLISIFLLFFFAPGAANAKADNTNLTKNKTSSSNLQLEAFVLYRDTPTGTDITGIDQLTDQGYYSVTMDDIDLNPTTGLILSYNKDINGYDFFFSAFTIKPFKNKRTFGDMDEGILETNMTYDNNAHLNPGSDIVTSNSDDCDWMDIEHQTYLYGGEANYFFSTHMAKSSKQKFFFGVRGLYFGEKLKTNAYDSLNDFLGTDDDIDRVNIKTINRLIGLQIGIQGEKTLSDKVKFNWDAKFGYCANYAERQRNFSSDDNPGNTFSEDLDETLSSQIIEISPKLNVQLSKNIHFTAGGTALWINGVSEAGTHFRTVTDFEDQDIRGDGDVLFCSINLGITIKF